MRAKRHFCMIAMFVYFEHFKLHCKIKDVYFQTSNLAEDFYSSTSENFSIHRLYIAIGEIFQF